MPAKRKTATVRKTAARSTKKSSIKLKKTTLRTARPAKKTRTSAAKPKASAKSSLKSQARPSVAKAPAITADKARAQLGRVSEVYTKSQLTNLIAELCQLSRKDVNNVFECLNGAIQAHLAKNGPQVFKLPGLLKFYVQHKPAQKAREGINPFTGEKALFKAKPAKDVVKVRLLKQAKEFAK